MANKKRGLKILMYHKKGKAVVRVMVRLENSVNIANEFSIYIFNL